MPLDFNGPNFKNAFDAWALDQTDEDLARRAHDVAALAAAQVPVRSGDLQASIHEEKLGRGHYRVVADAKDYKGNHYGLAVEEGFPRPDGSVQAAQPYMLPALEAAKD